MLSDKQVAYIGPLFNKLAELLFRDDATSELAVVVILALGRFVHMHPPSDLLNQVFEQMISTILNQPQVNVMLAQVVLRCIYHTTRFTRIHTALLVQQLKLVSVLQSLIDKNLDDKLTLSCLQILKEVVISGFHLPMIDNQFLSTILRII